MCIVVDANVWFDLYCGGLHVPALSLGRRICSVDVVVEQQLLSAPSGQQLTRAGLRVEILAPEGVMKAQIWRQEHIELEIADVLSLALASVNGWTLATRDGPLARLAAAEQVPVMTTVELILKLSNEGLVTIADLNKFKKGMFDAGRPYDRSTLKAAEAAAKAFSCKAG